MNRCARVQYCASGAVPARSAVWCGFALLFALVFELGPETGRPRLTLIMLLYCAEGGGNGGGHCTVAFCGGIPITVGIGAPSA
jgi:hypothetical protein